MMILMDIGYKDLVVECARACDLRVILTVLADIVIRKLYLRIDSFESC